VNEEQRNDLFDRLPEHFKIVEADEDLLRTPGTKKSWAEALGHELDDGGRCRTCGRGQSCIFHAFYDAVVASVIRELDKLGHLTPSGVMFVPKGQPYVNGVPVGMMDPRGPVTWCEHVPEKHGPEAGCVECRCIWPRGHVSSDLSPTKSMLSAAVRRPDDDALNDPFGLWGPSPSYRCYVNRHKQCEPDGVDAACTCQCGHQNPVCACNSREIDWDGNRVHYMGCPTVQAKDAVYDGNPDNVNPE
jgi:hypothetical protein